MESDLATEKSEVHATTGMNLKTIMLHERRQIEKVIYDFICMKYPE